MSFDFEFVPDRLNSDSIKWHFYDPDVLPMWVADSDYLAPPAVIEALKARVDHGVFGYGVEPPQLRKAIVDWAARDYGWEIQPDWIEFVPGVVAGFNLISHTLAAPGGGVLFHTPAYPPFRRVASRTGTLEQTSVLVRQADGSYAIDFDEFEAAFTPETRLFILCNPQNPTGRVFTRQELERMAEICLRKNVIICSDEIHCDLIYSGYKHISIASLSPEIAAKSITLMAPSKTFNIAGLECSLAVIPDPELRKRIQAGRYGMVPGISIMAGVAAEAAYLHGKPWLQSLMAHLEGNRDFLLDFVRREMPGIQVGKPEGTFLAWMDCRSVIPGNPAKFFLEKARVGLNDGEDFGAPGSGFVRLNFACPRSTLQRGLEQMKQALRSL